MVLALTFSKSTSISISHAEVQLSMLYLHASKKAYTQDHIRWHSNIAKQSQLNRTKTWCENRIEVVRVCLGLLVHR